MPSPIITRHRKRMSDPTSHFTPFRTASRVPRRVAEVTGAIALGMFVFGTLVVIFP